MTLTEISYCIALGMGGWAMVFFLVKLAELVVVEVARKKFARTELTKKADELEKLITETCAVRDKYLKLLADAAIGKEVLH